MEREKFYKDIVELAECYEWVFLPTCCHQSNYHSQAHLDNCSSPNKMPIVKSWRDATYQGTQELKQIYNTKPNLNWSVKIGSGFLFVDLDGEKAVEFFNTHVSENDRKSWSFVSPSGGMRVIYRITEKLKKKQISLGGNHQGIDFLTEGSLSVVPPSVGINGVEYKWINRWDNTELLDVPETVMDIYNGRIGVDGKKVEKVEKAPVEYSVVVDEGGRDIELTRRIGGVVTKMKDLPLDSIMAACHELNRKYCNPPLEDSAVESKVLNFYQKEIAKTKKAIDKAKHTEDVSPTNLANTFVEYLNDIGYLLKYHIGRELFYCTKTDEPCWKSLDKTTLQSMLKQYIDKIDKTINKRALREEIIECMKFDMVVDPTKDARVLELGRNKIINIVNDHDTVAVNNGIVDLVTGELLEWNPLVHNHSFKIDCDYIPKSEIPKDKLDYWYNCMETWLPDEDSRHFLQEFMGYCLVPRVDMRAFAILTGAGSNGKSMFLEQMQNMFGNYTTLVNPENLSKSTFATSTLVDKMLYVCADADDLYLEKTGVLKQLSGGDAVQAEFKFGASFSFYPAGKLIMSANKIPQTADMSLGYFDRIQIVRFNQRFKKDPMFKMRLEAFAQSSIGMSVMLNWCIEGYQRYAITQNMNFTESHEMKKDKTQLQISSDNVLEFLSSNLTKTNNPKEIIQVQALYNSYKEYCIAGGVKPNSKVNFTRKANEYGYVSISSKVKTATGYRSCRVYKGYVINADSEYGDEVLGTYNLNKIV